MFLDCYILAEERTATAAMSFVSHFVRDAELSCDPADPAEQLGLEPPITPADASRFLEKNPSRAYTMYFRNTADQDPAHAIVAFNDDGSLVLGLSVTDPETAYDETAKQWLDQMRTQVPAKAVVWGLEMPPPSDAEADSWG